MEIFLPICLILAGLFSIVCAVKDYDWFMENRKARPIVAIFGRNGAKIFLNRSKALISSLNQACDDCSRRKEL